MKLVAWMSSALASFDRVFSKNETPQSRGPVVLVHGIYSTSADFARLAGYLRAQGHEVLMVDLTPSDGSVGLEILAQQIADFTAANLQGRRFDLVGFSMGGLVSRYYMQRLGGALWVDRFVTLAAPHAGTVMASFNRSPGGRQMRRGSAFTRDLEADQDCLNHVKLTCFYTPLDLVVLPCKTSAMPGARNISIWALMHPSLIFGKRSMRAVAEALRSE